MKRLRTLQLLLALAAVIYAATANAAEADGFKVNGVTVPQSRIDLVVKSGTAQGQPDTPELRNKIKEDMITVEVLMQEAAKKGFDKDPAVLTRIENQRQNTLINAYLEDYVKANPVADEIMKKEYDLVKAQSNTKEYKSRHILVETEAAAKKIIAELKKGGSFEKIAAKKSKDPGSKGQGGSLDWSHADRFAPEFALALGKLKKGQLTDKPVKTQFGWHVIRLDDERTAEFPAFEEVKPQIEKQMQRESVNKLIDGLRTKATIE